MRVSRPSGAMVVSCIALLLSLGVAARAANTVFSTDIVDGEVKHADLGNNSVTSINVYPQSLSLADLAGVDVTRTISFGAGAAAAGRCIQSSIATTGAKAGDVPIIATQGTLQNGVFIHAMRTPTDGSVQISLCNMSGTTMTAISNLSVRIITFR